MIVKAGKFTWGAKKMLIIVIVGLPITNRSATSKFIKFLNAKFG